MPSAPRELQTWGPTRDPIEAAVQENGHAVLAVITEVDGPSYRPVGACMTFLPDDQHVGSLSSGCIESDLALHAKAALAAGRPKIVRYGRGSPFRDLELPCGGGLEILLLPRPSLPALTSVQQHRAKRVPCTLWINRTSGELQVSLHQEETRPEGASDQVRFDPEIRFLIFGKGPEATTFAALVQSASFENVLLSTDEETLAIARAAGCETQHLRRPVFPKSIGVDPRSAIVLFFHDHELEPEILASALSGPAFYVGAQGSLRAAASRNAALQELGVSDSALSKLRGPIGLIASARDPRTLAVSVLAEILDVAKRPVVADASA